MEKFTLIISEKPNAATRIAQALAEGKVKKVGSSGAYWLEFERKGKKHVCVPAVGHLFALNSIKGNGWEYPDFDVEWVPTYTNKGSEFTKKYLNNIKKLVKDAEDFIVATDFDTEGEVIGYNILRFICKQKDAKRMKFSTLTKGDLEESYDNVLQHIELGQAEAGLTRHFLDFYWGINTTRALTLAMKENTNGFVLVSSGRVQSPTLYMLTQREIEIRKFFSTPFWQLELHCLIDGQKLIANYEEDRIWEKPKAKKIFDECKGKDATVKDIEKRDYKQKPPFPLDTTTLQTIAYTHFNYSPKQTMSIAEELYNAGLISYPRTGSQKLPEKIGYKKILDKLSKNSLYKSSCEKLLKQLSLKPTEGKKCVTGDTHIILSNGEILSIKDLVENNNSDSIITMNNQMKVNPSKLTDKFSLSNKNEIIKIILNNNDKVSVTPDHPLFVLSPKPCWMEAKDLKEEMFIAVPEKINVSRGIKTSSILEVFDLFSKQEKRKILLSMDRKINKIIQDKISLRRLSKEICKDLNYKHNTIRSYFQKGKLPSLIIDYLIEKKILSINNIKENIIGFTWAGTGGNKIVKLPFHLNTEFSYFLGLIAADGHNTGREIQITDTPELRKVFREFSKFFDLKMKKYTSHLSVASKLLCEIMNKLYIFKKKKSNILDVHNLILRQPDDIVSAYIAGFFDGDGSVFRNNNTITISLSSRSKIFLKKIKTTLLTFSITSRFHENDIRIYSEDCHKFLKIIGKHSKIKKDKLESLCRDKKGIISSKIVYISSDILKRALERNNLNLKKIRETIIGRIRLTKNKKHKGCYYLTKPQLKEIAKMTKDEMFFTLADSDIIWREIKKISREKYNLPVYDVTTETHSFIGNDIILHNCDPAHPAIYPTGEFSGYLTDQQRKVYDLIVRRFLSVFGAEALRESMKVTLDVNNYNYLLIGKHTIELGWIEFYGKYAKFEEQILPELAKGQTVKVKDLVMLDKETQPPKRYTQGSIVKEMEKKGLGTKATRANIIQTLYDRGYIKDKVIRVTGFGEKVAEVLAENCPKIISEELTKKFEEEMEDVSKGKKKREEVIEEAKALLTEMLKSFKEKQSKIGEKLSKAYVSFKRNQKQIGKCPKCDGNLKIIKSKRTGKRFIGCENYPKCDCSYPLPQFGVITVSKKKCPECGLPMITVKVKARKPYSMCIDHKCKSKENWGKKKEDSKVNKVSSATKTTSSS